MSIQEILFYTLSALILVTGGLVAFRPRPIEGAVWLVLNFFFTAALYVLLGSHFVAVVQVLVYAGAILVLFIFVIFLLNLDPRELGNEAALPWTSFILFLGFIVFLLLALRMMTPELLKPLPDLPVTSNFGTVEALSRDLIRNYVWSFEVAGFLLLLAVIGVGLLVYRRTEKRGA